MTLNSISLNFQRILRDFADFGRNNSQTNEDRSVLSEQRCKHVELEQFLACFGMDQGFPGFVVPVFVGPGFDSPGFDGPAFVGPGFDREPATTANTVTDHMCNDNKL